MGYEGIADGTTGGCCAKGIIGTAAANVESDFSFLAGDSSSRSGTPSIPYISYLIDSFPGLEFGTLKRITLIPINYFFPLNFFVLAYYWF